jgi:hypothetical protein
VVRALSTLLVIVVVVAGCSSDGGSSADPTTTTVAPAATPTTAAPTTAAPPPTTAPPVTLAVDRGLTPGDVLVPLDAARFSYAALAPQAAANLDARLRADPRVADLLTGVAARGVRLDGRPIAVVVAAGVDRSTAADSDFLRRFEAAVTQDAAIESEPLRLGQQEMVVYERGGLVTALWRYENVFLLISGRSTADVFRAAAAIVSTLEEPLEVPGDLDGDFEADPAPAPVPESPAGATPTTTTTTTAP